MPARSRTVAVALVATLGLTGLTLTTTGPAQAAGETVSQGVTIPAFYTPPSQLPAKDGALVRTEPLKLAIELPGTNGRQLPGKATRIMYKSTDNTGKPVAVTGAYVEPTTAWKGSGPRPLVVVAPGTMGQGDQCSASLGLERGLVLGAWTASVGYENLSTYQLLLKGAAVVVTDYVGLGSTERLHTYVDRVDGGHAVLDAARAAKALKGTSLTPGSKVGLYGYSQGGGAVASAAELQATYAPDVALVATYSGAPPADLQPVTKAIDGSELAAALGWSINGFLQSDPELRPIVEKYLNAKGRAALKDLATSCVGDGIFKYAYQRSSAWTTNGETIDQIVTKEPVVQAFFADQVIGKRKPAGIVRVATGVNDNLVPHQQAKDMAANWCKKGGNVVYEAPALPNTPSALLNHFAPLLSDQGTAVTWLTDRLAGRPALSNCLLAPMWK